MHDENQAPPDDLTPSPVPTDALEALPPPEDQRLGGWLIVLLLCGAGALLLGMQELAGMAAIAGLFVAAQAADVDPRWRILYYLLSWVVPVGGAGVAVGIVYAILQGEPPSTVRTVVIGWTLACAGFSLFTVFRSVSEPITRILFRTPPSHTLRLAARMVAATLLLAVPAWFAFRTLMDSLLDDAAFLFDQISLGSELVGYIVLALAGVGFLVRRDLPAALERLGIRRIPLGHVGIIAIGVVALYALNSGADWIERMYLPRLWESDQRFNELLASGLGPGRVLLLGLSAGIGEEITMRGALQPKLGLVLTSLLFAALHVQYSWFGVLVIFVLGMILGTIRSRTSTGVAMAVHTIYDVIAIFSVSPTTT